MAVGLKIRRRGEFIVNWNGDKNSTQCGAKGTNILRYIVAIKGSDKYLNPQGFIIDNNEIHAYFIKTYAKVDEFVSCEKIAAKACRDFRDMFEKGPVKIYAIEVTVGADLNVSSITSDWVRPPTRRLAVKA